MTDIQPDTFRSTFRMLLKKSKGAILICLLTLLVYANSFPSTFIQDDHPIVQHNVLVRDFSIQDIFTTRYWQDYSSDNLYRPLTLTSFSVDQRIFGNVPWGYHLVNLSLHLGIALLLLNLLSRFAIPPTLAWLAAAIFAVHPIHTEVLNQAVGRSELLATFFMLAGILLANRPSPGSWALTPLCFLFALLAKEHSITLLAILPVLDAFQGHLRTAWKTRWPLYGGMGGVALGWLAWRSYLGIPLTLEAPSMVAGFLAYEPLTTRILTALELQWLYLGKLLFPFDLQAVYSRSDLPAIVTTIFSPAGMLVVVATLTLAGAIVYGWRKRTRWVLFAVLYGIAFSTTANLFLPIGVAFAERLAYWPSIWFSALLATLASSAMVHWRRTILISAGLYLTLLTCLCPIRNRDFATERGYWLKDISKNPDDALALASHANLQLAQGETGNAAKALDHALELEPNFVYALQLKARLLSSLGKNQEALASANRSLVLTRGQGNLYEMAFVMQDLGAINLGLKEYSTALDWLEQSHRILGERAETSELIAEALTGLGRDSEALLTFRSVAISQGTADGKLRFIQALLKTGREDRAGQLLEQWLKDEQSATVWNLLGVAYVQQGNLSAAASAFQQALRMEPGNARFLDNLRRVQDMRHNAPPQ